MSERPTDLREVELRGRVEAEVRQEFEEKAAAEVDRDRAMRAVVVSAVSAACVLLPLLAAVIGGCVRIFGWASGLY